MSPSIRKGQHFGFSKNKWFSLTWMSLNQKEGQKFGFSREKKSHVDVIDYFWIFFSLTWMSLTCRSVNFQAEVNPRKRTRRCIIFFFLCFLLSFFSLFSFFFLFFVAICQLPGRPGHPSCLHHRFRIIVSSCIANPKRSSSHWRSRARWRNRGSWKRLDTGQE